MNITVFGASGGIGSHVVALAAQRGHHVCAVYRAAPGTPPAGQAKVLIVPDIFDRAVAAEAIRGTDVVIAGVGPNFATRHNPRTAMTSPPDLHQGLARTLIAAMHDSAPQARLICVSSASMGAIGGAGAAAGVLAGGILTTWLGWRAVFWSACFCRTIPRRTITTLRGGTSERADVPADALQQLVPISAPGLCGGLDHAEPQYGAGHLGTEKTNATRATQKPRVPRQVTSAPGDQLPGGSAIRRTAGWRKPD
jgi:NAD(P)H-binding